MTTMDGGSTTQPVRIIITGGTFDKEYDAIRGELTFRTTHLPSILESLRLEIDVALEINQLVDSLEMSDDQRRQVVRAVWDAPESRVIVTHGTDTMTTTAAVLGSSGIAKTVVLTGAMIPHAVTGSDALFNLGCAVMAVQILPVGVYVVMNGRVFPWDGVRKNRDLGVFEVAPPPDSPGSQP